MSIEQQRATAHVHWLVVGPLSGDPRGDRHSLTASAFPDVMEGAALQARTEVEDRFGDAETRSYEVSFPALKSFTLNEVVQSVSELRELLSLAERLTSGKERLEPEQALAAVEQAVGRGRLHDAVAEAVGGPPAGAGRAGDEPASSGSGGDDGVEGIFAKADVAKPAAATKAVDSFVGAVRSSSGRKSVPKAGRSARRAIEDAVYATAADILRSEPVSKLESAWRGLKMLSDQCATGAGMMVEAIDVPADGVLEALRQRPAAEELDDAPDAVFVPVEHDTAEGLAELARLAEGMLAPVVTAASPAFFGIERCSELPDVLDEPPLPEAWKALRGDDCSRWLSVAVNRVVLLAEGAGDARRAVLGNPVWALATMLAQSYRHFGSFARVVGKPGALRSPGVWTLREGRDEGMAAPTETFLPVRAQNALAGHGFVGLGSARNGDTLILSTVPTARGSEDAMPLPAQMLTGRIVRFATWVRDQLPAGSSGDEITQIFHEAATVFLLPGLEGHAAIGAELREDDEGGREVVVQAKVRPEHALVPLDITFPLPLSG